MEDPISVARRQLRSFRIKELKDVLGALGLSRQGKKQTLFDKVEVLLRPRGSSGGGSPDHAATSPDLVADAIATVYGYMQGRPVTGDEPEPEEPLERQSSMEEAQRAPADRLSWGTSSHRYQGHTDATGASRGAGGEREGGGFEGAGGSLSDSAPLSSFVFEHRGGQGGAASSNPYSHTPLDTPTYDPRLTYGHAHSHSHSHSHSHRQSQSQSQSHSHRQGTSGAEDPSARQTLPPIKFRIPNPQYSRRPQASPPVPPQPQPHTQSPQLQPHLQQQQLDNRGHIVGPGSATKGVPRSRKGASSSSAGSGRRAPRDLTALYGEGAHVQCVCGRNTFNEGDVLVLCKGGCGVLEHASCVLMAPEKEKGVKEERPKTTAELAKEYYCELCRLGRGDPYLVTVSSPVPPTRMHREYTGGGIEPTRQSLMLSGFRIPRADLDLLARPHYLLQVWCMQLNDRTPNRIHWPAYPDLQINGRHLPVIRRPGQQLLGANGRDEGHPVGDMVQESSNFLHFRCQDARPFCLGLRVVRCRSYEEVLALVPPLDAGESLEEAMRRVERCVGAGQPSGGAGKGKTGADSDDSDDDLVVMAEAVTLKLADPNSGLRIQEAGRFRECAHLGCFDLPTLVQMNRRAKKWQCPVCMRLYTLSSLVVDAFFQRVCAAMAALNLHDDIKDVELKAGGFWRPKLPARPGKAGAAQKAFEWRDIRKPLGSEDAAGAPGLGQGAADEAESAAATAGNGARSSHAPSLGATRVLAKPEPWAGAGSDGAPPNGTSAPGAASLAGAGYNLRGLNGVESAAEDGAAYKRRRVEAGERSGHNHNHHHNHHNHSNNSAGALGRRDLSPTALSGSGGSGRTGDGHRGGTPPLGQWPGSGGGRDEAWLWDPLGVAPGVGGGASGNGEGRRGGGGGGSMRMDSEGREEAPIVLSDSDDEDGFAAPIALQSRSARAPAAVRGLGGWGPEPGGSLSLGGGRSGAGNASQPIPLSPDPPLFSRVPSQQALSEENVPLSFASHRPFSPPPATGTSSPRHSNGPSPLASPPSQSQRSRFQAQAQGQGAPPGARQVHRSFSPLPVWGTTGGRHASGRGGEGAQGVAGLAHPSARRDTRGGQGGGASTVHRVGERARVPLAQWLTGRDRGRAGEETQAESSGQTLGGFPLNVFVDRPGAGAGTGAGAGSGAGAEEGGWAEAGASAGTNSYSELLVQPQSQSQSQAQSHPQSQPQAQSHAQPQSQGTEDNTLREGGTYAPTLGRSLSLRLGPSYQAGVPSPPVYQDGPSGEPAAIPGYGDPEAGQGMQLGSSSQWGFMNAAPTAAGTSAAHQEAPQYLQQQQRQGQQEQGQGQGQQGRDVQAEHQEVGEAEAEELLEPLSWSRWPPGAHQGQPRRGHQRVVTDDIDDMGAEGEGGPGGFPVHQSVGGAEGGGLEGARFAAGLEEGGQGGSDVPQADQGPASGVVANSDGWVSVRRSPPAMPGRSAQRADQGAASAAGLAGEAGRVGDARGEEGRGEGPDFDLEDPEAVMDALLMQASGVEGARGRGEDGGHIRNVPRSPQVGERVDGEGGGSGGGGGGLEAHQQRPGSRGRTPSLTWDEREDGEGDLILTSEELDELGEPPEANGHAAGGGGLSPEVIDALGGPPVGNGHTGGGRGEAGGGGGGGFGGAEQGQEQEEEFWLPPDGGASSSGGAFGQQRNWLQAHQAEHA